VLLNVRNFFGLIKIQFPTKRTTNETLESGSMEEHKTHTQTAPPKSRMGWMRRRMSDEGKTNKRLSDKKKS
jgi:hypothetical protein